MKRWFHKNDGGLIRLHRLSQQMGSVIELNVHAYCPICRMAWEFSGIVEEASGIPECVDWVPFFGLSQDLQAAALEEML